MKYMTVEIKADKKKIVKYVPGTVELDGTYNFLIVETYEKGKFRVDIQWEDDVAPNNRDKVEEAIKLQNDEYDY
jgi:hypothetical protein